MRLSQARDNIFTITATGQELSALIAGAKMALDIMQQDERAPREAVELLTRVLRDYDRAIRGPNSEGGSDERPPSDSTDD